jgi:gliding motility-associated-like protein
LTDDFNTLQSIRLLRGNLNTAGKTLQCFDFISETTEPRVISFSTSEIAVNSWSVNGSNLILDAANSHFMVKSSLKNNDGTRLIYNDVDFTEVSGTITNTNVYAVFNKVNFINGSVSGDCTIDSLVCTVDGNISGSDSVNYIKISGNGFISGGKNVVKYLECDLTCSIIGENSIDSTFVSGDAGIIDSNILDYIEIRGNAVIQGNNVINKLSVSKRGRVTGENIIHQALLNGDSFINGLNEFDILNFTAGRTYTFGINSTTTINNDFNATGTCYEPIRMLSDTNGIQATIIKLNGAFVSEFLSLRDLKAEGTTPFVVANSVDLGNNTNWNIQTTASKDLFWVNGQGNWSEPVHWDVISGGPGGHCPPTEIDNAFFDENSFSIANQIVQIDIENGVCHDMSWEDATGYSPVLSGADTCKMRVYGSLFFNEQMNNSFEGEVFFEAIDSAKIIRSAGQTFQNHVWFTGRGGFWDLEDDFTANNRIYFQQGGIKTRGNLVTCKAFSSSDTTTRYLNLSTSTVKLLNPGENVWLMNGANLTLKADSSLLQSWNLAGDVTSINSPVSKPLVYNNVEFYGNDSELKNDGAFCKYNLVTFFAKYGQITGDCNIDTATFHGVQGKIFDSDTIKTAIFHADGALIQGGNHVVEIAYFYDNATVEGHNIIDTALFYRNAFISDTNLIDTTIVYNKAWIEGTNIFGTATLLGDGNINGNNTFSDLTLSKGRTYYFENGATQTINDNLNLQGACTDPIILQSDENTVQSTLHKVNGNVEGEYLQLRDMKATGNNLPFMALNSVDLGNNPGWDISISAAKELYWVNGTGNWSDSLHWAGVSGGDGGYCIPTPIDNVYFDQNSFGQVNDTVFIDVGNATCHNMNWTGAIESSCLSGPDTCNLRIYGSLKLNPQMKYNFAGPLFFETTEHDHTIETNGITLISPVIFQGIGGEWKLVDDLKTAMGIDFKHGNFDLNEKLLTCRNFNANFPFSRHLDIANAAVTTFAANLDAWHLNAGNLIFEAENSIITSTGGNGLIRTEGGGNISYNNVYLTGSTSRVYNINTQISFNNIFFIQDGSVHGNCIVDSLIFGGSGSIYDSDTINFAHIQGSQGNLIGGEHVVGTILFDENATILGNNSIDSTIIFGDGNITGTNIINKSLIIGKNAIISGQNNFGNTILMGNGQISGTNIFKSLKLTPGNIYELEENITQNITENFTVRGNNCFPITLRSQQLGQQANISVPAGIVVSGDFIELRDINATGGATFYAGNFSDSISNNNGWIFTNAPGYIYGFAADTTICASDISIIGTQNFNPDKNSTFLWHDGSTGAEYLVKPTDTFAIVTVFYATDCSYTDSIGIFRNPSPSVLLGDDLTICQNETIYPQQHSENVDFLWMDGSEEPFITASITGDYWVVVTNEFGCRASDTIYVEVKPVPLVDLGNDTIIRANDFLTLDAGNPDAVIVWSTGETSQTILGTSNQTYWVAANREGCVAHDTIFIDEFPPCALAVPTAFSPNADGANDVLFVRGQNFDEFELLIFNRWGEMVFTTNDSKIGWDGIFKGQPQAVDAYNFILKGKCVDGTITTSKGTITLLR